MKPKSNHRLLAEPLLFNPQELDLRRLREIPELNIAATTGIPKDVLERGGWSTKPVTLFAELKKLRDAYDRLK